ncbi:uncharacterized protein NPIL_295731 [Nephila pilipes]|uniref:DUF4590 domain-containing protein n=1 Tax=Nephila pilipes TaxID=299642 RepID=A0A8X6QYS8_NEPPI|nr:uncharacterized protein NPIL_295731 [Nephila pilipes]
MWTIAAVNKKIDGPLGTYNGLTDIHLAHYFSRPSQQSHLKAAKLITNDGTIIPEQKVKIATLQYEKKKKMYDMLANTVIQTAAHKEGSWNKKLSNYLEDVLKMDNVEKIKGGSRKKREIPCNGYLKSSSIPASFEHYEICKWFNDKIHEKIVPPIPRSAPTTVRNPFKNSVSNLHFNVSKLKRCFSAKETSPYVFPLFLTGSFTHNSQKSFQKSVLQKKKKKKCKKNAIDVEVKNSNSADIASSKITKLSIPDQSFNIDHCKVTLYYHGHSPLTTSQIDVVEEMIIRQQHCGGTPVIIYKGQISSNESFTFICLDHDGFTFSITVFLDGIRYLKLSSCCIFRYSPGKRLGGSSGCFSIQDIQGGKPCLKCQYRENGSDGMDLTRKFMSSENARSLEPDSAGVMISNFNEGHFAEVAENDSIMNHKSENDTEDRASSVASEVIHSPSEEIAENLEIIDDNQDTIIDTDVMEDVIENSDANISIEENLNVVTESSSDSESSANSIADSVKNVRAEELQVKPYESENSDEDDEVKEYVVVASVHGSPTNSS